jgi:hypothetical protein
MTAIKGNSVLGTHLTIPTSLHIIDTLREQVELEKFIRVEVVCEPPRTSISVVEGQVSFVGMGELLPLGNIGCGNVLLRDCKELRS